jgi:CheY-like chemotaxis protein
MKQSAESAAPGVAAANGDQALHLLQQRDDQPIDLLFTNVLMPNVSDQDFSDRVLAAHPRRKSFSPCAYTVHQHFTQTDTGRMPVTGVTPHPAPRQGVGRSAASVGLRIADPFGQPDIGAITINQNHPRRVSRNESQFVLTTLPHP